MKVQLRKLFSDPEETVKKLNKCVDAKIILLTILADMKKSCDFVTLNDPNWAIKRAYYDGKIRVIDAISNILDGGEEEND